MKIEVICTYELPSTREIDLPIDSWEDLESWYVKDGVLYYKIHNMPWESEKLEAFEQAGELKYAEGLRSGAMVPLVPAASAGDRYWKLGELFFTS